MIPDKPQDQPSTPDTPVVPDKPQDQPSTPDTPAGPTVCTHAATKLVGEKAATYFASGYSGDKVCAGCDGLISQGTIVKKLKLKAPKFKLVSGKKQFKVKYTKVAGATGFQVRYKIKGKWKVKTFKAKKNATKLIKKLKKGTYKVQVRAMVKNGSKKAYSAWSKTSKVKVK